MSSKLARPGSEGNMRLLKAYGGGSTPPRQHYATGGAVKGDNPSLAEGLAAGGSPAKASLARPGRKMPGKGKKDAKTNVNVVIMPKGEDGKPPMPPPGAMAGLPPPPMPPGPPMPPPGAGGPPGGPPPPMMRKAGGRVNKAEGGEVDDDPVPSYLRDRMRDKKDSARMHEVLAGSAGVGAAMDPTMVGKALLGTVAGLGAASGWAERKSAKDLKRGAKAFEKTGLPGRPSRDPDENSGARKSGGRVNDDAKADKAMVAKGVHKHEAAMHKGKPMTKLATGGPAKEPTTKSMLAEKGYQGGGGGAMGRLEKIKKFGK